MRSPDASSVLGGVSNATHISVNSTSLSSNSTSHKITTISPPTYRAPEALFFAHAGNSASHALPNVATPHSFTPTLHSTREVLLSADVREKVELALSHGWAASTLRGYDSNVKQFRRWCDKENIPQMLQFPADEFVLCAFAASDVGRLGGGTARKKITAIKAWDAAHNAPWNGSKRLINP